MAFFAMKKMMQFEFVLFLMQLPSHQIFFMDKLKCFSLEVVGNRGLYTCCCFPGTGWGEEAVGTDDALT